MHCLKSLALLALSTGYATLATAQVSGSGTTTRYWDCCKGSCSWPGKASVSSPVKTCNINDQPLSDANAASGCGGGTAYMCSDQSPWAVSSSLAYGFAAVSIPNETEANWCCACYELTFTSTSIAGKKMIVQATNTGGDLAQGQFDLAIPGGGVGIFNGCTDEWGAPSGGWGAQYGGISSDTCSTFPQALQPGCSFRFGSFFEGADNPTVDYKQVTCPKVLTDKTGCVRSGETPTGSGGASSAAASPSSIASPASSAPASSAPASSVPAVDLSSSSYAAVPSSTMVAPASGSASSPSIPVYSTPPAPVSSGVILPSSGFPSFSFSPSSSSLAGPVGGSSSSVYVPAPSSSAAGGQCEIKYVYV